jgi:hypothetical protein
MKRKKLIQIILILNLVSAFLLIAHNNAPILLSFQYGWGPVFLITLAIFYIDFWKSKLIIFNLFFYAIFVFVLPKILWTEMSSWYRIRHLIEPLIVIIASSVFFYLSRNIQKLDWFRLSKLGIIFIAITSLSTLIAIQINPMAVRASYSGLQFEIEGFQLLKRIGIATYGFMMALVMLIPMLIYLLRHGKKNKKWILFLLILTYITVIRASILANLLLAIVITLFASLGSTKSKRSIFSMFFVIFIILLIPENYWSDILIYVSEFFESGSLLNRKLVDFSIYISGDHIYSSTTGAGLRVNRYSMLWEAFTAKPLTGDASYNSSFNIEMLEGGHLYWMSRLALWGVLGFIFYVIFLFINFRFIWKRIPNESKYYFLLSIIAFCALGFMKSLNYSEPMLVLFVIIPGLLYWNDSIIKSDDSRN